MQFRRYTLLALPVVIVLMCAILTVLPGVRRRLAAQFTPSPIPENQHLIVSKEKWHLHGAVKRVELYAGERWDDRRLPPRLLEVLEFDQAGRVILQERYSMRHRTSDISEETTSWHFDSQGHLIGMEHATHLLSQDIFAQGDLFPWMAYDFIFSPQNRLYMPPPSQTRVDYDRQGNIHQIAVQPDSKPDVQSMVFMYDTKGNPSLVSRFTGSEAKSQSRITYDYDAAGNWIVQRRDNKHLPEGHGRNRGKESSYRFLRRIAYYSGVAQQDKHQGTPLTRDAYNLQGPVTAIEGQALLERAGEAGLSVSFTLPAFRDRVEFDQQGRVVAAARWDGDPQPENLMLREQFVYDTNGSLHGLTIRNIHPNGIRSYAVTGRSGLLLGETLLPQSPVFLYNQNSSRTTRYDESGRLNEEQIKTGGVSASAVCRYDRDNGLITVTGQNGKVTDRIRLDITRDKYGNLLSRRYRWEIEAGIPSTRIEEIRYRISYAGGQTEGGRPGSS